MQSLLEKSQKEYLFKLRINFFESKFLKMPTNKIEKSIKDLLTTLIVFYRLSIDHWSINFQYIEHVPSFSFNHIKGKSYEY